MIGAHGIEEIAMIESLARNWWAVGIRGIAAIIFGVLAFVWPGITLIALALLFGAYALVDGVLSLVAAIRGVPGAASGRWMLLLEGVLGIAAGILAFIWPDLTALVLLLLIGAWAIVTGVLEIIAAIRLRREIEGEWVLALAGLASIVFGALVYINPSAGALAVVWLIGAYAIVFGIALLVLAWRLRGVWEGRRSEAGSAA
jgi:uncharacterized membrane protein HdeD (DUF308 family)